MPDKERGRAKTRGAEDVTVLDNIQADDNAEKSPSIQHRPRTRAWVKKQKDKTQDIVEPRNIHSQISPTRRGRPKTGARGSRQAADEGEFDQTATKTVTRSQGRISRTNQTIIKAAVSSRIKVPRVQQKGKPSVRGERATDSQALAKTGRGKRPSASEVTLANRQLELGTQKQPGPTQPPTSSKETPKPLDRALSSWLDDIESPPRGLHTVPVPSVLPETQSSMYSSSNSRESRENESTVKVSASRSLKVTENKLRLRRVNKKAVSDERIVYLRSILKTELPSILLRDIDELRSIAEEFLQQIDENPDDNCYSYIDEFSYHFDAGKSRINYPVINRRYFDADLLRCLASNEAVLQRTVMIHIINQYWLGKIFDWNSEGQWSQPKDTRLPSREDDDISMPKPDLAISFTLQSFTGEIDGSDPIPADLERCIYPDGGERCFPFLFMEVKKAGADLQDAYTANLHSASQALYNMYNWMVQAKQEELFFQNVRVFSLVFNAQDLSVRVHRAEKLPTAGEELKFQYDEFAPLARYTKDQACLLVKTILNDYATPELHPALKTAFVEVIKREDERVASKRKATAARSSSMKRARKEQNTGQSFNMGNLST